MITIRMELQKRIFPAVFRGNQQWYGHFFRVAFKPVATIMQKQESLDNQGNITEMTGKGRHDPCVVPRAVPIVEAMAAIVLADFYLINKTY
jgi:chorismate synthase